MKRIAVVLSLILLVVFAVSVQTQNQKPTPPSEIKALEVFNGEWTFEGEDQESPLGPEGKFSGKLTVRWILNGFFQEWKWVWKGASGEIEDIEFDWYDPATKRYPYHSFHSNGVMQSGYATVNGNVWNVYETETNKGIQYKIRCVMTIAPDGMTWTIKVEISTDDKTWKPLCNFKLTKINTTQKE